MINALKWYPILILRCDLQVITSKLSLGGDNHRHSMMRFCHRLDSTALHITAQTKTQVISRIHRIEIAPTGYTNAMGMVSPTATALYA